MHTFLKLCYDLGVPIAEDKTLGPTTILPFLGFIIDSALGIVFIPHEKLAKLHAQLTPMLNMKKMFVRDLESVTGLLSFCSRAIPSARTFIRRFYDILAGLKVKKSYYKVRLNEEVKADVAILLEFLDKFNGHCYFPDRFWISNVSLKLFTDSSGSPDLGCGAFFNNHWCQLAWPSSIANSPLIRNLAFLELIPVVLALYLWGDQLKNKRIIFYIDNLALVSILNKNSSKDKSIMKLVRHVVLITMLKNIQFKAFHIETSQNQIADALSRFQMHRFRTVAQYADMFPTQIPEEFWMVLNQF